MRRFLEICVVLGGAAAALGLWNDATAQGLAPGTIKLLSKNPMLVDTTTSEGYVQISSTAPGKFLIVGPAVLQADLEVNLKPGEAEGGASSLEILVGGKSLKRFTIRPKKGAESWKGRTDIAPAAPVGFLMEVDPGPHAYEFKFAGTDQGAGLFLVPQAKSRRPLAANAPLVPAKPPAPVATPAPGSTGNGIVARATPAPTPTPKSIDQIAAGGRAVNARMDRLPHEVSLLGGVALPGDSTFKADGSMTVGARWGLGDARTWAVGLEVGREHFGGLSPSDPTRASLPYALNVDLTPITAHATWYAPIDGKIRPYAAVGGGVVFGQSSWQSRAKTVNESHVGPTADGVLGVEFDLGAGELHEGKQKILVEARETYANVPFAAHEYKDWSSTQVLLGVAMKF